MGSFSVWHWTIGLGLLALILWRVFRAPNQPPESSTADTSVGTLAYQAGRKFRRSIDGATHGAGAAYAKSRAKSVLETKTAKYDALAKLKALHESGVISDREFETEKTEILGQ